MAHDIPPAFDCQATAAVLRSGNIVALAGHVAVVVSLLSPGNNSWIRGWALLVWCVLVYLAIRVKIDASLFDVLAAHPPEQLDSWLDAAGLRKQPAPKTIPERRRGAMRLWRALVVTVLIEIALLLFSTFRLLS